MKRNKIFYYVATVLFTLLMLFSVGNYVFNTAMVSGVFSTLGYPGYLLYPLGLAKLLGILAIWFSPYPKLREWAYAGFFFNTALAFLAHVQAGDGDYPGALVAFVLLLNSYIFRNKAFE